VDARADVRGREVHSRLRVTAAVAGPRRVLIQGVSGSGKSTVGRALAQRLDLPYVELDALHHGPNWTEATAEELRERVRPWVERDEWVIDGGYFSKLGDMVLERSEAVVWLDVPVRVWLPRLTRRTFGRMITREELWNGNRESFKLLFTERPNIFEFAWRRHFANRRELVARVEAHPGVSLVRLRSPGAVHEYLQSFE
jgi:adenylate kinase family enzyme